MKKNIIIIVLLCIIVPCAIIIAREPTKNTNNTTEEFIVSDHILTQYLGAEKIVNIPDDLGIVEIGEECFKNNLDITHIKLPYGTTKINDWAFAGCNNLKSMEFPETLLIIGDSAFFECGFENIVLPQNITFIDDGAFAFCRSLSNITLPDNLYVVSDMLFLETKISELVIPNKVITIGSRIFNDSGFTTDIRSIVIPPSVQYIAADAFIFCPNLIIKGYQNSYAEQYSYIAQTTPKEFGLPFQIIS